MTLATIFLLLGAVAAYIGFDWLLHHITKPSAEDEKWN
jgi:hypothetical protein